MNCKWTTSVTLETPEPPTVGGVKAHTTNIHWLATFQLVELWVEAKQLWNAFQPQAERQIMHINMLKMHIQNAYCLHIGLPRQMHITLTLVFANICIFAPKKYAENMHFLQEKCIFSVYFQHIGLPRKIHISLTPVFTNICIFGSPKICRKYPFP